MSTESLENSNKVGNIERGDFNAAGMDQSISDPVEETAKSIFGVPALFPFQRHVIANTIEGQNQLVLFPTGGGKSMCFQLPALLLPGLTVVVCPLLALLADQVRALEKSGIPALVLKGGQTDAERAKIFTLAEEAMVKILYATPEILQNRGFTRRLREAGVSHFVVDEAHLISEWGVDFRPAFRLLGRIAEEIGAGSVSAFTATASTEVTSVIAECLFGDRLFLTVQDLPDRPNIFYKVIPVLSKQNALIETVNCLPKPLLVFTRSRKNAERCARLLRERIGDEDIFFYHAGLNRQERQKVEEWFYHSENGILAATCAYGMGVDKKDIRSIVHFDVPLSVEAYLQESGRAGRDGKPAEAVLLHGYDDLHFPEKLDDDLRRNRYKKLLAGISGHDSCRRMTFASLMGERLPACSGCDVCSGTCTSGRLGETEILGLVRHHARRFTAAEILDILAGVLSYKTRDQHLESTPGFGALRGWEKDDIREAMEVLEQFSIVRAPEKGFFKHRYSDTLKR